MFTDQGAAYLSCENAAVHFQQVGPLHSWASGLCSNKQSPVCILKHIFGIYTNAHLYKSERHRLSGEQGKGCKERCGITSSGVLPSIL